MECFTTPGINRTTLFREVIGIVYLATDSGNPQKVLHRKRARCARSLSAQALHGKRTMRAACPSYIGRPGKQPAGSIQAESAPKVGYRGVGERLEAVEHGSYAPDGPLGAIQHSSVSRLLEPFTTGCGCLRYASRVSYVRMCKPPAKCQAVRSGTVIYERAIVPYITCDVSQLLSVTTNES